MIIRIVKMTFKTEEVNTFLELFREVKPTIKKFEGCLELKLLKDVNVPNSYFTYSHWVSEDHLNKYRFSDFFKNTWSRTKILFEEKAEAWSLEEL